MSNHNFFRLRMNINGVPGAGDSGAIPEGTVRTVLFVVALTETTGTWSNITSTSVSGALGTNWDPCADPQVNGETNSNSIIAQSGHTNSAAKYCLDFSSGGYSDWYLGSNTETVWMSQIYEDSTLQNIITNAGGTAVGSGYYWSSTQAQFVANSALISKYNATSQTQKTNTLAIRPQKTLALSPTSQYNVGDLAFGGIIFKMDQLNWGNVC